jgi:hypothetical protein
MGNKRERHAITVGELKMHLASFTDDDLLYFGGLEFYRTKQRGPKLVQIEFKQNVYIDDNDTVVVEDLK